MMPGAWVQVLKIDEPGGVIPAGACILGRKAPRREQRTVCRERAQFRGGGGGVRVCQAKGTDTEGLWAKIQKPE